MNVRPLPWINGAGRSRPPLTATLRSVFEPAGELPDNLRKLVERIELGCGPAHRCDPRLNSSD